MTWHQILKMADSRIAALKAEAQQLEGTERTNRFFTASVYGRLPATFGPFALPEKRGRDPKPRPQLTAEEKTEAAIKQVDRLHDLRVREVKRKLSGE